MEIIILILLLVIVTYLYISSMLYVKKIKKELLSIKEKPKRVGYYKEKCHQGEDKKYEYEGIFNVTEIDRYKNGDSRIKLINIELSNITDDRLSEHDALLYLNSLFVSLIKTNDVEWLDSVEDIKDQRQKKLQELEKIFKK